MSDCKQCNNGFEVTAEDRRLSDEIAPMIDGEKQLFPDPLLCPDCRFQRRLAFRNERVLYHRKSDMSGKQIVSMFAPEKPYKVYDQDEWWSDKWDAMDSGRDFDFNRTFTEQFRELSLAVPHNSLYTINAENSYYTNFSINLKNSYLVFGAAYDEDCLFGKFVTRSRDLLDCLSIYDCERCYEGVASQKCYHCQFFTYCRDCSDCLMVEDCQNCKNCLLCFGLRSKEYCFMNEPVGKEKWQEIRAELGTLTNKKIALLSQKFAAFKAKLPHIQSHFHASEDCTGDMLFNCKGCNDCYDLTDSENCRHTAFMPKALAGMDCTFASPDGNQFSYENCSTIGSNLIATFFCWYDDAVRYSTECANSRDLFGCIGLKSKQYCIFNRQYTKEDYEKLLSRIIGHMRKTGEWGEYLHPSLSTMGYDETIANEYFPRTSDEAAKQRFGWWGKLEMNLYKGPRVEVPENIREVTDDICGKILLCAATGKPYKIIPQELKFYRENGLPVPLKSPDVRHRERLARRNGYHLWSRTCANCGKAIKTTYSPERPVKVYCEDCYLKTVY